MLKLYKRIDNKLLYWETWEKDSNTGIVHWGKVGEKGETKEVKSTLFSSYRGKVQKEANAFVQNGYKEFDPDELFTLLIEFSVDGIGTPKDLTKRTRLEERMDEVLGWVGLGHCDGGSMGSGTMEVCCLVVDFEIAKSAIEKNLAGSDFAYYKRIYDENNLH
jgi:hypothetical protein